MKSLLRLFSAVCMIAFVAVTPLQAAPRIVRVGHTDNPPLSFRDAEGKVHGLYNDILEYVAQREDWRLEYRHCLWSDCLEKLDKGELDLLTEIAFSKERSDRFHFTAETLFSNWGVVVSRTAVDLGSILGLEGKTVASLSGGIHGTYLMDQVRRFGIVCRIIDADSYGAVLEMVREGQADFGVVSRLFARRMGARRGLKATPVIFNPVEVRYASPGSSDRRLVTAIDIHLAELKRQGDSLYHRSLAKWIPGEGKKGVPVWVKYAAAVSAALLLVSVAVNLLLRVMVGRRTSELMEKNAALTQESKVRLQTEEALRESGKSLRSLMADSPVPTVVNSLSTKEFRYANKAYCHMRGHELETVVGRTLGDVGLDFGLDPGWFTEMESVLRKEGRLDGVECERRLEGGELQTLLASSRIITLDGEICAITSLIDITDRKRAEEALRESEIRYREIFESVGDALVVTDLGGNIIDVNGAACRLYGYAREEMLGLAVRCLVSEPYHPQLERDLLVAGEGQSFFGESVEVCKDGALLDVELKVSRLQMQGKSCMLSVVRDVTERKRAEAELKKMELKLVQGQKMEAIGTLSGGIAHDFNNILAGIIGYAELAKGMVGNGEEKLARHVSRILEAAARARDLVRQILAFSRRDDTSLASFSAGRVVKEALELLRATLPKNIEIHEQLHSGPDKVMGDVSQIHQVVMNLCTNAWHAMGEAGGTLTVQLESERLASPLSVYDTTLPPGDYHRLTVADSGKGMDAETIRRIFEPYFTTKEKGAGTGLGLSVTLGIVKNHGGAITVRSSPAAGTEFTVLLPLIPGEAAEGTVLPAPVVGGDERILLLEDEALFLEIAHEHLAGLGYRVTAESDSQRALARFREAPERFDLVITDQSMPKMTGVEVATAIGGIRQQTPVLLCTGFSEVLGDKTAEELGIAGFVMKPVTRRDLATAVRKVLDEKGTHGEHSDH